MNYFYACIWFGIGIYLIIKGLKEYKILTLFGGYFILLGFWWIADELLTSIDLLYDQPYANILRIVSAIVVIFGIYYQFKVRKKRISEENSEN